MHKMLWVALNASGLAMPTCELIGILPDDQAIVDDAFYRHYGRDMPEPRGRFAIVMQLGENRCVHLHPRPLTLGPSPTYCYNNSGEFIAVYGREP